MPMHPLKPRYSTGEAARILGMSPSNIRRWIKLGRLQSYRTPGGNIRILLEQLLDFSRRTDIPLSFAEAAAPDLLLALLPETETRRRLLAVHARFWARVQLVPVVSRVAFWQMLAREKPRFVVIESPPAMAVDFCAAIRETLSPAAVRIGIVSTGEVDAQPVPAAEATVGSMPGNEQAERFWQCLLPGMLGCSGHKVLNLPRSPVAAQSLGGTRRA